MSKNQVLFRIGLWIFLFTLISSIIFAWLQGRNPKFLDSNLFYASTLGFISSATIMTFYAYSKPLVPNNSPVESKSETPHGDYSGVLTAEDGLPAGYSIIYNHAYQEPIFSTVTSKDFSTHLPPGIKFDWTVVKFGNARVVIEAKSGQVTIPRSKDIKLLVKKGNDLKISIG